MAITANDLLWRPSKLVSDSSASLNGGAPDYTKVITSNVKNNLFPDVSQAGRLVGETKYRKVFLHVNTNDLQEFVNVKVYVDAFTPGGDLAFISNLPTLDDMDLTGSSGYGSRVYGVGTLSANVSNGATSLVVSTENWGEYSTKDPFKAGDWILVKQNTTEDTVVISSVTEDINTETITINFSPALAGDYTGGAATVSSMLVTASVKALVTDGLDASLNTKIWSSLNGGIVVTNKGAVNGTWTLTFTSATDYSISEATLGAMGTGTTSADTSVNNTTAGVPYFTIKSTAYNGTFLAGDVVTFKTYAAAIPVWLHRVVPAGTGSLFNDYISLAVVGES